MKATIELPDDLYRRVKAKSAMQGRAIREVTEELYRVWLAQDEATPPSQSAEEWLTAWVRLGRDALADAPDGPSATGLIDEDRGRLDES